VLSVFDLHFHVPFHRCFNGVVSTDLQLRISPTRAVVIDPEMFEPAARRDKIYNSQAELRNLIDYIRMMLAD